MVSRSQSIRYQTWKPAEGCDQWNFAVDICFRNRNTSKVLKMHLYPPCKDVGALCESKECHMCIAGCYTKQSRVRGVRVDVEHGSIEAFLVQEWRSGAWICWFEDSRERHN